MDREALHELLFRRADRNGRLKLNVTKLAEELGRGYCNLVVIIGEMADEGRFVRLTTKVKGPKSYQILDPEVWRTR